MGRPKKVLPTKESRVSAGNDDDEVDMNGGLMVQSRARRTIKPNPKYNSKEIIPLKRLEDDDDDEEEDEHEGGDDSDEDEDFRDDGAKDSDAEGTPPARKRGRPRIEVPRSEPPPANRKLQQIRAGLKEVTMSTSKIMQAGGIGASLEKKRKIDYDDSDDFEQPPEGKRRATPLTMTRGSARVTTSNTPSSAGEKENTLVAKKSTVNAFTLMMNKNNQATATKISPGVSTRRQQTKTETTTTTATPKTGVAQVRLSAAGTPIGKTATTTPVSLAKSMIQVRRATPMNTSPGAPTTTNVTTSGKVVLNAAKSSPAVATTTKERVVLNRSPMVKTKSSLVQSATPTATINLNSTIKSAQERISSPISRATTTTIVTSGVVAKSSPVSIGTAASKTAPVTGTPAKGVLNKIITTEATTVQNARSTLVIPAGAEVEQMADGTTARITTMETRYVVRVPAEEEQRTASVDGERPMMSLLQLRNEIKALQLPTDRWTYQLKLVRIGTADAEEVPDRPGYAVHSVVLNRMNSNGTSNNGQGDKASPRLLNGQKGTTVAAEAGNKFDRTVELQKTRYNITIDGRQVKLVGAPRTVADTEDLLTLLEIVNEVTMESPVVKPAATKAVGKL